MCYSRYYIHKPGGIMGRIVAIGVLSIAVFGCAGVQEKRQEPAAVTAGPTCPTLETEVPPEYCDGLPEDYGLSRRAPVEWGLDAAAGVNRSSGPALSSLYYGRLLCPDGSTPTVLSRTMAGPPLIDSTSQRSRRPKVTDDSQDIIDYWKIQCGDTMIRMYSNSYRCGSLCVPKPFKLMPAAARRAHEQALELERNGRADEALALHEKAVALYGESVRLQTDLIHSYLGNERPEQALHQANAALQKMPRATHIYLLVVFSLKNLGRIDEAQQALTDFFRTSHPDDDIRPAAFCARSMLYEEEGKHEDAAKTAMLSCQMGFKACCDEGASGGDVGGPGTTDSGT